MTSQHLTALATANATYRAQATLINEIRSIPTPEASALVASLLEATQLDRIVGSIKARRLLVAVREIGEHRAEAILRQIGVFQTAQTCRVRELTDRQRYALAAVVKTVGSTGRKVA